MELIIAFERWGIKGGTLNITLNARTVSLEDKKSLLSENRKITIRPSQMWASIVHCVRLKNWREHMQDEEINETSLLFLRRPTTCKLGMDGSKKERERDTEAC